MCFSQNVFFLRSKTKWVPSAVLRPYCTEKLLVARLALTAYCLMCWTKTIPWTLPMEPPRVPGSPGKVIYSSSRHGSHSGNPVITRSGPSEISRIYGSDIFRHLTHTACSVLVLPQMKVVLAVITQNAFEWNNLWKYDSKFFFDWLGLCVWHVLWWYRQTDCVSKITTKTHGLANLRHSVVGLEKHWHHLQGGYVNIHL